MKKKILKENFQGGKKTTKKTRSNLTQLKPLGSKAMTCPRLTETKDLPVKIKLTYSRCSDNSFEPDVNNKINKDKQNKKLQFW